MKHNLFPEAFMERAIALDHLGVDEVCWYRQDALSIIEVLHDTGIAVLGGDVLEQSSESLLFRYA